MVCFSPSIEQQKQFYKFKANDLSVVWSRYNGRIVYICVYRHLLTNRLHDKAAKLCWLTAEIAL